MEGKKEGFPDNDLKTRLQHFLLYPSVRDGKMGEMGEACVVAPGVSPRISFKRTHSGSSISQQPAAAIPWN